MIERFFNNQVVLFLVIALWPGFMLEWTLEWVLVVFLSVFGMYKYISSQDESLKVARAGLFIASVMATLALVSLVFTILSQRFDSGPRDLIDAFKPFLIFFPLFLSLSLAAPKSQDVQNAATAILVYSIASYLIIKFEVPFFGDLLNFVYSETKMNISDYSARHTIPFENPNFLGYFSVLCLFIGLYSSRTINYSLSICALIVIGLTGSRTAWTLGGSLLIFFLLESVFSAFMKTKNVSIVKSVAIVLFFYFLSFAVSEFIEGYERLTDYLEILINLDFSRDASYAERDALRGGAMSLIMDRSFFGWGAVKYSGFDVVDNQFFGFLLRYGVAGILVLVPYMYICCRKYLQSRVSPIDRMHLLIFSLIFLAWLWTGSYMENVRLVVLTSILINSFKSRSYAI